VLMMFNKLRSILRMGDKQVQNPPAAPSPSGVAVTPLVSFLDGGGVALEVLQAISYRNVLKTATIVSYNMQDYDFWGHGALSHLLLRQLALGASIRLMTTPPPGKPTSAGFKAKYKLLSVLQKNGIQIFLNEKLHAKAYLFLDTNDTVTAIVGSANLTGPGFGMRLTPDDNLVEMATLFGNTLTFKDATEFVENKIVNDKRTEEFATWFSKNSLEIGKAGI
jgi:hypothetical protein